MINPAIFRKYDIRGSSLEDITPENSYKLGFCFSKICITKQNNLICVGMDGRLSSSQILKALVDGLIDGGGRVISLGMVPTPMLYFADKQFKPAASIMVTGSHNPKNDNGFKMVLSGRPFFGTQIEGLALAINETNWDNVHFKGGGAEEVDLNNKYLDEILKGQFINSNLKIAWDPGNGAAGKLVEALKTRLTNSNFLINTDVDGNFPNHHPDPTVLENLKQLMEVVKRQNCDFGIAFDGDADRIGVINSDGQIIFGDQLLCIFAKDILAHNPKATIIADVKTSQVVFEQIEAAGGKAIIWKTGHSFIKNKILETGSLLAGEMSGHIFFADRYYGYDDAIYAAIRLIDLVSRTGDSLEKMTNLIPKTYNTPEIRIHVEEKKKFSIIDGVKKSLSAKGLSFNDIDGIRLNNEHGWWLIRASNTEAALILRFESKSEFGLLELKQNVNNILNDYHLKLPC
jgi:phosphomannomutase